LSVTPLVGGSHKRARVLAAACELIAAGAIVPLLPPSAKPGGEAQAVAVGAATPDCRCLCRRVRCPLDWFAAAGYQIAASYELLSCPAPATQETGPISGLLGMNTIIGSPHPRRIEW
jgi:hypothetical protein